MSPSWFDTICRHTKERNRQKPLLWVGLLLLLVCGYIVTTAFRSPAIWAVKLDGVTVGWVENRSEFTSAWGKLQAEKISSLGEDAEMASEIEIAEEAPEDVQISEPGRLARDLAELATYTIPAALISVDGEVVAALSCEEEANSVLDRIVETYCPDQEDTSLVDVEITQRTEVLSGRTESGQLKNPEEALRILLRGTDEVITHQVEPGESLWSIAVRYDLSVEDLKRANPQLSSDILQIGQNLDMVVPKPYLTVKTKEVVTETLDIPYPTRTVNDSSLFIYERKVREAGKAGKKEATWEVVRENGLEVERSLLEEKELFGPVTQVVAMGTKMPLAQGTGSFSWPLNRGTITSQYGSRGGRLHSGVDIGSPTGTPIQAADSGVVTMAQWYGNYGNSVVIDHGNGKSTLYGHCSKILVQVGNKVSKGQHIANVGSTGRSTGSHLHFEIREGGRTQDPMRYFH